jgi:hypothetical protein
VAAPVVTDAASELYDGLTPFADLDSDANGWGLLNLCAAITKAAIDQIHGYVTDTDELPGWGIVLDPAEAPEEVLDWLAQFVGSVITPSMDAAEKRAAILLPRGFQRCTPDALYQATRATLSGSQTVLIDERYTGDAWKLRVRTITSETPDETATLAAVVSQKPIGILLTYAAVAVHDWGDLIAHEATWADVQADYDTWLEARTAPPGT